MSNSGKILQLTQKEFYFFHRPVSLNHKNKYLKQGDKEQLKVMLSETVFPIYQRKKKKKKDSKNSLLVKAVINCSL